jgi:uracil-DNA glycosylase
MATNVRIETSWKKILQVEFEQPYFEALTSFIRQETALGKVIYPAGADIFRAFELCPFADTKVVILGQDPYHGPGQAHGLCFSVQHGVAVPPSLRNIYKELHSDLDCAIPEHGNLTQWAHQGVLLLNASLSVEAGKPMSHSKAGWEQFTDATIGAISAHKQHVVFILWGAFAQRKKHLIDGNKHSILEAAHPSPLSAHNGFWNSKPFSKTNALLAQHNLGEINWQVT